MHGSFSIGDYRAFIGHHDPRDGRGIQSYYEQKGLFLTLWYLTGAIR